jgi:tryptophan synthase alpha chain
MNAGHERLGAAFSGAVGSAALMPYMMAGFPSFDVALEIGRACVRAGADVIELGVPFSDPLADGPVIHAAGTRALAAGSTVDRVLELAAALAADVPVVLMCYANPILARGYGAFAATLTGCGVSGLIVPDLPLEEAPELAAACEDSGVALVPLVAPTTTDARLEAIGARARGFVYTVSLLGTTGERAALSDVFAPLVARTRQHTDVPVAVGFGIATAEQALAAAQAGADGVIVGSRLVRAADESEDPAQAVGELVAGYAAALATHANSGPDH